MRARDIAVELPNVTLQDPVTKAVRLMAETRLPGLIVVDDRGRPEIILPGTQVLRMTLLNSYQEDSALTRAIDEEHADRFWTELGDRAVAECLPLRKSKPITVPEDATLLEIATMMARQHSPLVAVVDGSGALVGGVTLQAVLSVLALPSS